MAEIRSSSPKVRMLNRSQHVARGTTNPWRTLTVAGACSVVAFCLGDFNGHGRAQREGAALTTMDELQRMDCLAQLHARKRGDAQATAARPATTPPQNSGYTFHQDLRGGPAANPVTPQPAGHPPVKVAQVVAPVVPPPTAPSVVAAAPSPLPPAAPAPAPVAADVTMAAAVVAVPVPTPVNRAALAATPTVGSYTLQAGSFPNKEEALRLFEQLKKRGLKPTIVPSMNGDQTWFRVRVGRYSDRTTADAGAQDLLAAAGMGGVVTQH